MKMTYNQIVDRIKSAFIKSVETYLEIGQSVDQAIQLGKTISTVAVDTGHSAQKLRRLHRVYLFWGQDRIPNCTTWQHYQDVADTKDVKRKNLLIRKGDAYCAKTTRNAQGVTKGTDMKVTAISNSINMALVLLRGMQIKLTTEQTADLRARVTVLEELIDVKGTASKTLLEQVQQKRSSRASSGYSSPSMTMRQWAQSNGFSVQQRGKLPRDVVLAYRAAHDVA